MSESYENFYPGSYSPFSPMPDINYGEFFTGYRVPFSQIGAPTSPQTANQLQEVSNLLSQGGKIIEVGPLFGQGEEPFALMESIPKTHFKEIGNLAKLTGAEISMHAPMVEPSGFTRQGWDEQSRREAESQLKMSIERAHEMNPDGNAPVTIHASSLPATEWDPSLPGHKKMIVAFDQESKQLAPLKYEVLHYPGHEEGIPFTPEERLKSANLSHWDNNLTQMLYYKRQADEMIKDAWPIIGPVWKEVNEGQISRAQLSPGQRSAYNEINNAMIFYQDQLDLNFKSLYDEAYRYAPESATIPIGRNENVVVSQKQIQDSLKQIGNQWMEVQKKRQERTYTPSDYVETYDNILNTLKTMPAPEHYTEVEKFAKPKSAETIANTALHGYQKYGATAPMICLENVTPNAAFGRAESLKELVEASRKKFVEQAKKQGINEGEARRAAERLIGATWDVGHINLLRKSGYTKEQVAEETKKIAPFVKHVHLTDNFGYNDSHLPPGMGDVPIKEILKELEKQGFSGKKIVEAGGFVAQFKTSPMPYILEALGSPIYGMTAQPFWGQMAGMPGMYAAGPYAVMPEQHFSIYGGGFSSLPTELGGQMPGTKSRMTGTPMD